MRKKVDTVWEITELLMEEVVGTAQEVNMSDPDTADRFKGQTMGWAKKYLQCR